MATIKTDFDIDKTTGDLVVKRSDDVGSILDANKIDYNGGYYDNDLSFGRKMASVPLIVLEEWIKEGIDYRLIGKDPAMAKKFKAKLNSPEFRAFKTHVGKW